ncbi:hypothetical protein BpHYR1_021609 [Brachionus plicatilis]|uniref:Uncharacterized protein n=1 Tax=Brachionus plicatilis TaxID=10195 RepID=A0A3M7SG56_BRAPC|nr:hypothetical protein BpHYR1_021609 [Brachionus plicatilis]
MEFFQQILKCFIRKVSPIVITKTRTSCFKIKHEPILISQILTRFQEEWSRVYAKAILFLSRLNIRDG